jgi:hypothetical protein
LPTDLPWPWADDTSTYYRADLRRHGQWNGRRIVSKHWVRAATAADVTRHPAEHHQYFWSIDTERPGRFYAMGNYGQYV